MAETFWKFSMDFCMDERIKALSALLNIPAYAGGALVALLYAWVTKKAGDSGSINDFTEKAIETACMWDGKQGALVAALHNVGILVGDLEGRSDDNPLSVASWDEVASDIIKQREASRKRKQKQRSKERDVTDDVTRDGTRDVTVLRTENKEQRIKEQRTEKPSDPSAVDSVVAYARENLVGFTSDNAKDLRQFIAEGITPEAAQRAVDEACGNGKSQGYGYTRQILTRYKDNGLRTIEDVQMDQERFQQSKSGPPPERPRWLT